MLRVKTGGALIMAAIVAVAASAHADGGARAEALFRAGREAMEAKDYARACRLFEASRALEPAAGTSLNLGECNEHLGKLASAWAAYADAADRMAASDSRRDYVLGKVSELEPQLARVRFVVRATGLRCRLLHAGAELDEGSWGVPLPADPGAQEAQLRCEGRRPREVSFEATSGQVRDVVLAPGDALARAAPDPVSDSEPAGPSPLAIVGWTSAALSLVGLAAGIATGVLAIDRRDEIERLCTPTTPPQCPEEGIARADEGERFATASNAAFIAAGALAGLGVTLLALGYGGESTARVTLSPHPGLSIDGSF
jgi:hypothetical protein